MQPATNLYEILELDRYASIDDVRAAFRRLAVLYHPDKNPGDEEAEEHFKQIANAYSVLGDEEKKREYDLRLSGMYIYLKSQQPTRAQQEAERRKKARETLKKRQQQEAQEIKATYAAAQKVMPYRWRYWVTVLCMATALVVIIDNWFLYDLPEERNISFAKMFFSYVLSLCTILFFLSSLFKRWNAKNLDRPYRFDIRNRISSFFLIYLAFMFTFSFAAPRLFKTYQLTYFGQYTMGVISGTRGPNLELIYFANGKQMVKTLQQERPYYGYRKAVTVRYSAKRPYICEHDPIEAP